MPEDGELEPMTATGVGVEEDVDDFDPVGIRMDVVASESAAEVGAGAGPDVGRRVVAAFEELEEAGDRPPLELSPEPLEVKVDIAEAVTVIELVGLSVGLPDTAAELLDGPSVVGGIGGVAVAEDSDSEGVALEVDVAPDPSAEVLEVLDPPCVELGQPGLSGCNKQ